MAEPGDAGDRLIRLRQNEQDESQAFGRCAARVDKATLTPSSATLARYRSATLGRPVYRAFPDLAFAYIGHHYAGSCDPRKPLESVRVLDLGAGDGAWSVILADQGATVTSLDVAPKQVELAEERMRRSKLTWDARIGSAYRLRAVFQSASFDLVFGQAVLHHLTYDLERVYDGIAHVLREGGRVISTEPYADWPVLRRIREACGWAIPLNKESPDERPLNRRDLAPLWRFFDAVELIHFDVLARLARVVLRSHGAARALFPIDRRLLANRSLSGLGGSVFIAAQR
jgi:2-polyprenyl-3-methyl-5-hydroxy-6-metoxy-1,4-benzoquinol methylase